MTDRERREAARQFHRENPHVWAEFVNRCFAAIGQGKKRISPRLIFEAMRDDPALQTSGKDYKINNNHIPFYGDGFRKQHPQYAHMIRQRSKPVQVMPAGQLELALHLQLENPT